MRWVILLFFLSIPVYTGRVYADQGVIAKRPYHNIIYPVKKRTLYIAVDKTRLTTLESVLTKSWKERVNKKILSQLDSQFISDKMTEYDLRVQNIKEHFDIQFVDWYDQNIIFKPAYRVGRGGWEKLPQGDYESHRWLQFFEWFVHEWDYPDSHERWKEFKWDLREQIYQQRSRDRKEFIEKLVQSDPDRYEYTEFGCYDIDEIGDCGYYWIHDKEKNEGVQVYDLGYKDIPMPTIPPEPTIQICPLDPNFKINEQNVEK